MLILHEWLETYCKIYELFIDFMYCAILMFFCFCRCVPDHEARNDTNALRDKLLVAVALTCYLLI